MEAEQMLRNNYKALATFRKVCQMGNSSGKNLTGCIVKNVIAAGIFMGVGFGTGGAGFALGPAFGALALGGGMATIGARDMSFLQFFLYAPALAVDIVRSFTVYPIKKLINKFRTRALKRKIIPVLQEMSYELDNRSTLSEINAEQTFDHNDYRISRVKNRHFKKIKKFFLAESYENQNKFNGELF